MEGIMKYLLLVILITPLIIVAQEAKSYNPCEDQNFLELSKKSINDMTEREYEFYILKGQECAEYEKRIVERFKTEEALNSLSKSAKRFTWLYACGIFSIIWILSGASL